MSFYEHWRELRGLTQQAFGDRWNRQNYRHANHGGTYEPEIEDRYGREVMRMGMDALEDLANGHIRFDDDKPLEATVEFFQAAGEQMDVTLGFFT